jgi:hypothetical protein
MKLLCKIRTHFLGYDRGHVWRQVGGTTCMVCIRCRENGWLIRDYR